jgi:hypothetical protein
MITLLVILFKLTTAFAFEINEVWNHQNKLQLEINCADGDRFCNDLCHHNDSCEIEEKICYNCVGTSLPMNSIFEQMGQKYRNTEEEVSPYELIDFLTQKKFISFTSKSIFNQIDAYDSPLLKTRFQGLCSTHVSYPIVLFELGNSSYSPKNVKYVLCSDKIFKMSDTPIILTNFLQYLN